MTHGEALIYGIIQGVAEYLPISSSAHLILLPKFMQSQDMGQSFDVFLHLATLLSTLVYFWREWLSIFKTFPVFNQWKCLSHLPASPLTFQLLLKTTIPALIAGAGLQLLPDDFFRSPLLIVFTLTIGGIVLYLTDHICQQSRGFNDLTSRDAWMVGIFQCFALIPGVSRAGATIIGGRLLGLNRQSAAKLSFLMSAPIIAAAVIFKLRDPSVLFFDPAQTQMILIAFLSAFLSGCLAIGFLLRLLNHFGYLPYAIYRIVLAVVVFYRLVLNN